ncbi:hypothetical protein ACWD62_42280 [Streptomyces sp. NPDC005146]
MATRRSVLKRSLLGIACAAIAAGALVGVPASSAYAADDPLSSPTAYTAWLSTQSGSDASRVKSQFSALPADKQTQFLTYLKDPALNGNFVDFLNEDVPNADLENGNDGHMMHPSWNPSTQSISSLPAENPATPFPANGTMTAAMDSHSNSSGTVLATEDLAGGDINLSVTAGIQNVSGQTVTPQGTAGDWNSWYRVNDTLFGIKITQVKIWVNYHSTTSRVTKVYSADASHYNYVPFSSFGHGTVSKWISAAGNAHAQTTWTGTLYIQGYHPTWSAVEHMWADETGFRGGSLV